MGEARRPLVNGVEVDIEVERLTGAQLREAANVGPERLLAVLDGPDNRLVSDNDTIRPEWREFATIPRFRFGS